MREALGKLHPPRNPHPGTQPASQPARALLPTGHGIKMLIKLGKAVNLCCCSLLHAGSQNQGVPGQKDFSEKALWFASSQD